MLHVCRHPSVSRLCSFRQPNSVFDRLHGLRGERSNVPREARYFTEWGRYNLGKNEDEMKKGGMEFLIENLGNFGLKILGILYLCRVK